MLLKYLGVFIIRAHQTQVAVHVLGLKSANCILREHQSWIDDALHGVKLVAKATGARTKLFTYEIPLLHRILTLLDRASGATREWKVKF